MFQPSSMFIAREIKEIPSVKFFLKHPLAQETEKKLPEPTQETRKLLRELAQETKNALSELTQETKQKTT